MPYAGRGGAGNIEAAAQAAVPKSNDLEANLQTGLQQGSSTQATASIQQEYAYTGRGGAGNYYSPSTLTQSGTFSTTIVPTSASNPPASTPLSAQRRKSSISSLVTAAGPLYSGRGGAGNFRGDNTISSATENDAKSPVEEEIKAQVERDVEIGLAKPAHAWLGGREVDAGLGFQASEKSEIADERSL